MIANTTTVLNYVNTGVVCFDTTFVLDSFDMNNQYGQRLRLAREHKKLSQDELAELSGVKQGTISKIERGDQGASTFDIELSDALGIHPLWLKKGDTRYAPEFTGGSYINADFSRDYTCEPPIKNYLNNDKTNRYPRVVGTAQCGQEGYYMDLEGGDGYIEFEAARGAIAIKIKGHSMHPAIKDGWFVIIEPNLTAEPGEYVLIKFKDGKKMIKELIHIRPDGYLLLSVNGNERITALHTDLESDIQPISAILPPRKHKEFV